MAKDKQYEKLVNNFLDLKKYFTKDNCQFLVITYILLLNQKVFKLQVNYNIVQLDKLIMKFGLLNFDNIHNHIQLVESFLIDFNSILLIMEFNLILELILTC